MADTAGKRSDSARRRAWPDRHLWEIQPIRDLGVIAIAVGLIFLGYRLSVVTAPLLLALLLAYLLEPIVSRIADRGRLSRSSAAIVLIIASGVLIAVPLAFAMVFAIVQAVELVGKLPDIFQKTSDFVVGTFGADQEQIQSAIDTIRQWVESNIGVLAQGATAQGANVVAYLGRMIGSTIQIGLLLFLVPFFFYFFSTSHPKVAAFGKELIPKAHRERWLVLIGRMDEIVSAFIRGQLVIALILGLFHAIGWLIIGVPSAILLGVIAGVLSLVPYVIGLTLPVAIGLLWFDQSSAAEPMSMWWIFLGPTIVYVIAQLLEGYVLQPLIHGKSTNLDAATIVAAVIASASIAGIYGALLAIPVVACLKIILTDVVWPRVHDWLEGRAEDPLPISTRREDKPES